MKFFWVLLYIPARLSPDKRLAGSQLTMKADTLPLSLTRVPKSIIYPKASSKNVHLLCLNPHFKIPKHSSHTRKLTYISLEHS